MFSNIIQRIGANEAAPSWTAFGAAAAVFIAFLAIIIGTTIGIVLIDDQPGGAQLGWIIGAAITVIVIFQLRRVDAEQLRLSTATLRTPTLFLALVSFGFALFFDVIVVAAGGAFLPAPALLGLNFGALSPLEWLLAIILLVIAQPFADEIVFRGVVQPVLRASTGAWAGIFITAVLYAIFVFAAYPPNYSPEVAQGSAALFNGLIAPLLAGVYFGAVRAYTGSTRGAVIAHMVFGAFALAKMLVGF